MDKIKQKTNVNKAKGVKITRSNLFFESKLPMVFNAKKQVTIQKRIFKTNSEKTELIRSIFWNEIQEMKSKITNEIPSKRYISLSDFIFPPQITV